MPKQEILKDQCSYLFIGFLAILWNKWESDLCIHPYEKENNSPINLCHKKKTQNKTQKQKQNT